MRQITVCKLLLQTTKITAVRIMQLFPASNVFAILQELLNITKQLTPLESQDALFVLHLVPLNSIQEGPMVLILGLVIAITDSLQKSTYLIMQLLLLLVPVLLQVWSHLHNHHNSIVVLPIVVITLPLRSANALQGILRLLIQLTPQFGNV